MRGSATIAMAVALWVLAAALLPGCQRGPAARGPSPAAAPAQADTQPTVNWPDPDLWTRRNLEVIRRAAEPGSKLDLPTALSFSLIFNPLVSRDPYREQCLEVAREVAATAADQRVRRAAEEAVWFLSLPGQERELRWLLRTWTRYDDDGERVADDAPLINGANTEAIATAITSAHEDAVDESFVPQWVEEMDRRAREVGNLKGLAAAYLRLASDARYRGRRDRARLYTARFLAIIDAPGAGGLDNGTRIGLIVQWIGSLSYGESLAAAKRATRQYLAARSPDVAARLIAVLDGATLTTRPRPPASAERDDGQPDPAEERIEEATRFIAWAHAKAGDVETAARLLRTVPWFERSRGEELVDYQWAQVGFHAWKGGEPAAAERAFRRALAMMKTQLETTFDEERAAFAQEALDLGELEVARHLLTFNSAPGAWARHRLARAQRKRGNHTRAMQLTDEAIDLASKHKAGGTMAEIAADLYALGDTAGAENLLLNALPHIQGTDFGLSGTTAIVRAACEMNRHDLLDRIYEAAEPGEQMLISIIASHLGLVGPQIEDEERD